MYLFTKSLSYPSKSHRTKALQLSSNWPQCCQFTSHFIATTQCSKKQFIRLLPSESQSLPIHLSIFIDILSCNVMSSTHITCYMLIRSILHILDFPSIFFTNSFSIHYQIIDFYIEYHTLTVIKPWISQLQFQIRPRTETHVQKNLTGIPPSWKHLPYIQQQQQKFLWNLRGKKKECQNRNIHVLHIYKFFIQTQSILSTYLLELHNETYIRYNISHKFRQLEDFSTTIASITSAQLEKTFNTFSLSILPSPHKRYILVCIILLQCKIDFLSHRDSKE